MTKVKIFQLIFATLVSICVAAGIHTLIWAKYAMLRVFILDIFFAAAFAIFLGLPIYGYLRSRKKDSLFKIIIFIPFVYAAVYFAAVFFSSLSTTSMALGQTEIIKNGILTWSGILLTVRDSLEVGAIGCLANLVFWLIFARKNAYTRQGN